MTRDDATDVLTRLLSGIAPEVDLAALDPAATLTDEGDLDSMDFLNLVTALHQETGIEVPERDYPALQTVDAFVDYIAAHAGAGAG
jgi:acyl carrier protein